MDRECAFVAHLPAISLRPRSISVSTGAHPRLLISKSWSLQHHRQRCGQFRPLSTPSLDQNGRCRRYDRRNVARALFEQSCDPSSKSPPLNSGADDQCRPQPITSAPQIEKHPGTSARGSQRRRLLPIFLACVLSLFAPLPLRNAPRPWQHGVPNRALAATYESSGSKTLHLSSGVTVVRNVPRRGGPLATAVASPSASVIALQSKARGLETADTVSQTGKSGISVLVPRRTDSSVRYALKCALLAGIFVAVATSVTIAVFWVIQDSLVYKPTSVWRGSPKSSDMPYFEDVSYCTMDNVEISGWFIKRPPEEYKTARTLIYFHGTDKNASFRLKKAYGFYKTCRCNILLLSYRGYGVSTGRPNEKGFRIDAESALQYLESRGDIDVSTKGKLWVFGESLGGAVAIHFTNIFQDRINALVLENTFTSLLDMIKLEFPILGVFRYLSRNRWQSKKRIGNLKLPILFLSGQRDAYIPPPMMRTMYDLATSADYKEFVEFEQGTHNRTWTLDGFYEAVAKFMDKVEAQKQGPSDSDGAISSSSRKGTHPGEESDVVAAPA